MFSFITEGLLGKIKTIAIIVLTIVSIVAGGFGLIERAQKLKERSRADNNKDTIDALISVNKQYVNDMGDTVRILIQYRKNLDDMIVSNVVQEREMAKVILASNNKDKQLRSVLRIVTSTANQGKLKEDSILAVEESFTSPSIISSIKTFDDGFLKLTVIDCDSIDYSYSEVITALTAKRKVLRRGIWGKWFKMKKTVDRNKVELHSNNPNSSLDGLTIDLED